jgi:hypothetical protein
MFPNLQSVGLFNLFKARFCTYPHASGKMKDQEVVKFMSKYAKTRKLKKDNYPWTSYEDPYDYEEDEIQNSETYQFFLEYYSAYYSTS